MKKKPELKIDEYGNKFWYLNNKFHRIDGPAIECANGDKAWYLNGECHRINGPAIKHVNGDKWWYLNGKLHKIDGPAIEYINGDKSCWYLNGKEVKEEDVINYDITEREYIKFVINL